MSQLNTSNCRSLCKVALLLGCISVLCSATSTESKVPETFDVAQVDAYLAAQVAEKHLVGLAVALVKNGELVLEKGYGYRAQKEQLPVETDTSFAIGSVTKQFTCACVLLLAEDGKLSPDDRVAKYFPKLNRANEVTLSGSDESYLGLSGLLPVGFCGSTNAETNLAR